ncbi:MAG: 2-oxo-hepta-3-ene-1,7-dioic acid hydratase [Pseudomonadota bacterium]
MTPQDCANAAADLIEAEASGHQIGLLSLRHPEMGIDDAYAVQTEIIKRKVEQGRRIIGWKIGLTSKAMQAALGIDFPDSGVLFDDMIFATGSTVPKERFIQPRVEAEIAFGISKAISNEANREEILDATAWVAPALEILDTRIFRRDPESGTPRGIVDTISDNAANAGIVLGQERHALDAIDLRWVGAITFRDGTVEETGLGAGVLNDPVESVVWLAQRMASYGQRIEGGHVILSGSFIRPVECPSGAQIHADFGTFGTVAVTFEK